MKPSFIQARFASWLLGYCMTAMLGLQGLGLLHRQVHEWHGAVAHSHDEDARHRYGFERLFSGHDNEACTQFDRLACGDGVAISTVIANVQAPADVLQMSADKTVTPPRVVSAWPRGPPEFF